MLMFWGHPTPRVRRTAIAAVLAAVVLSGCGAAEKLSPQVAMRDAANTTVHAKQGTFTFSLIGSEDDLNAVLNEGAKLSDEDRLGLRLLGQSHIALTTAPRSTTGDNAPRRRYAARVPSVRRRTE